jgi:hypothetical protein
VVEGIEIVSCLIQTFETPAIKLAGEGFELALHEVQGHNISNEELFVVDLPCPTVRLREMKTTNGIMMTAISEMRSGTHMKTGKESANLPSRRVSVVVDQQSEGGGYGYEQGGVEKCGLLFENNKYTRFT